MENFEAGGIECLGCPTLLLVADNMKRLVVKALLNIDRCESSVSVTGRRIVKDEDVPRFPK